MGREQEGWWVGVWNRRQPAGVHRAEPSQPSRTPTARPSPKAAPTHLVEDLLAQDGLVAVQRVQLLQALGLLRDDLGLRLLAPLHVLLELPQLLQLLARRGGLGGVE